jgi:hypothetical protein
MKRRYWLACFGKDPVISDRAGSSYRFSNFTCWSRSSHFHLAIGRSSAQSPSAHVQNRFEPVQTRLSHDHRLQSYELRARCPRARVLIRLASSCTHGRRGLLGRSTKRKCRSDARCGQNSLVHFQISRVLSPSRSKTGLEIPSFINSSS